MDYALLQSMGEFLPCPLELLKPPQEPPSIFLADGLCGLDSVRDPYEGGYLSKSEGWGWQLMQTA